jgi:DNA-binding GntR family transcriptional regulator
MTMQDSTSERASAYERILEAIIYGDLPAGSPADEQGVARRYGLGLAGVRDALNRLALEGLVERQPRLGTRVATLGVMELEEIFEARVIVEGDCAALAAERATADDVAALRRDLDGYAEVIDRRDFRTLVRMDRAFHRGIAAATYNRFLLTTLVRLHNNASRFWYFGLPRLDPASVHADMSGHLDVVAAIERHDAARAGELMRAVLGRFPASSSEFLSETIARSRKVG